MVKRRDCYVKDRSLNIVVVMFLSMVLASALMSEAGLLSRFCGIASLYGFTFYSTLLSFITSLFYFRSGNRFVLFPLMGIYRFTDKRARPLFLYYGPMDILSADLPLLQECVL